MHEKLVLGILKLNGTLLSMRFGFLGRFFLLFLFLLRGFEVVVVVVVDDMVELRKTGSTSALSTMGMCSCDMCGSCMWSCMSWGMW